MYHITLSPSFLSDRTSAGSVADPSGGSGAAPWHGGALFALDPMVRDSMIAQRDSLRPALDAEAVGLIRDARLGRGAALLTGNNHSFESASGDWVRYSGSTGSVANGALSLPGISFYQIGGILQPGQWYEVRYTWSRSDGSVTAGVGDRSSAARQIPVLAGSDLSGIARGAFQCGFSAAVIRHSGGTGTLTVEDVQYWPLTLPALEQGGGAPVLAAGGTGAPYLIFDGIQDRMEADFAATSLPATPLPANATICLALRSAQSAGVMLGDGTNAAHVLGDWAQGDSAQPAFAGAGSPVLRVDGAVLPGTSRADLAAALSGGAAHVVSFEGVDLSGWSHLTLAPNTVGTRFAGDIAAMAVLPGTDPALIAATQADLATRLS